MQFTKYNSLENHYQERFIAKVVSEGLDSGAFVCTEKVHGANFSFWYDGTTLRTAKRSGFCDESFFSCHIIIKKYQQAIKNMYTGLLYDEFLKQGDTLVVYGEIFGGNFFGKSEPMAKNIQGGMNYHPDTEFMTFDIGIESDGNKSWLDFETMEETLKDFHIPMVPKLFQGSLQECLSHSNEFESKVPSCFDLIVPEGKKAQCEGFVIRPLDGEKFLRTGSRLIIKSKNSAFKEVGKAKKVHKEVFLSNKNKVHLAEFSQFINRARVQAVQSKEGSPEWKQLMMISGKVFQDAMEEFDKIFEGTVWKCTGIPYTTLKDLVGDEWTQFNKQATKLCSEEVRNYYKEVI